ncbi:hypothetical protein IC582_000948 [Cucumis melo]
MPSMERRRLQWNVATSNLSFSFTVCASRYGRAPFCPPHSREFRPPLVPNLLCSSFVEDHQRRPLPLPNFPFRLRPAVSAQTQQQTPTHPRKAAASVVVAVSSSVAASSKPCTESAATNPKPCTRSATLKSSRLLPTLVSSKPSCESN